MKEVSEAGFGTVTVQEVVLGKHLPSESNLTVSLEMTNMKYRKSMKMCTVPLRHLLNHFTTIYNCSSLYIQGKVFTS